MSASPVDPVAADGHAYDFSPEDEEFRRELRAFLEEQLPPHWVGLFSSPDALEASFRINHELAERGWLIQNWPEEYGGGNASNWRQAVSGEEFWAYGEPRGAQYMNVNWIGPAIMHFGTEEQKQRLLPPMTRGASSWAQLFSEPGAGSDLASLSTRADVQPDGSFVVNGQKVWISYAVFAEMGFLVARTEPGSRRKEGLSVLLVDLTLPGIEARPIRSPLGDIRYGEVFFTDAHIPADALLGPLHDGWQVAMEALAFERAAIARYTRSTRGIGLLERLPEGQLDERRRNLARLLARGRAAEMMNYRVVEMLDDGGMPAWEASASRVQNATYEQDFAALAEEALGPLTRLKASSSPSKAHAEIATLCTGQAPTASVTAGTNEIQLGIIAQRRLGMELAR
jgi:alkylation response protein AidB-like acyl-CoA dehydrogenase